MARQRNRGNAVGADWMKHMHHLAEGYSYRIGCGICGVKCGGERWQKKYHATLKQSIQEYEAMQQSGIRERAI